MMISTKIMIIIAVLVISTVVGVYASTQLTSNSNPKPNTSVSSSPSGSTLQTTTPQTSSSATTNPTYINPTDNTNPTNSPISSAIFYLQLRQIQLMASGLIKPLQHTIKSSVSTVAVPEEGDSEFGRF